MKFAHICNNISFYGYNPLEFGLVCGIVLGILIGMIIGLSSRRCPNSNENVQE